MPVEIRWIHHATFRIASGGTVLYIDPWKVPGAPHDADVIFVSHCHYDHLSKPDIAKVSKADTSIVAPVEVVAQIGKANAVDPGQSLSVKDITIETVAMYNIGKAFHPREHNWCGAVFTVGGKRIYYSGDVDLIPEMSDLKNVDLALLPVGGTYTMDASEAAKACAAIGCKAAVPYHWGDIVGTEKDAQAFAKAARCPVHVLHPGESLTL
jgi:L-ascorbate metabolism protein UlaG (beta-lactamase superfamily)